MKVWFQRLLYKTCVYCRINNSRTIRFVFPVFPFILLSVALLGAATITSTTSSYLILEANKISIKEGEKVSVDVYVYAHKPVNAVDLAISYPVDELEVTSISKGQSVITLWTQEPYIENNTAYLRGGTYRKGFQGEHFIARIDAVAKQSGTANVVAKSVRLLAGDGSGTEIESDTANGTELVQIRIANSNGELIGEVDILKIVTDIDGDGNVTLSDISRFMAAWHNRDVIYDFSGDGKMTFRDFAIILADSFNK